MKHRYLEVTFRNGRAVAAYFYLPRRPDDKSIRTERREDGLLVDFAQDGRPIGVEITAPTRAAAAALNRVLIALNEAPATGEELAPLAAA